MSTQEHKITLEDGTEVFITVRKSSDQLSGREKSILQAALKSVELAEDDSRKHTEDLAKRRGVLGFTTSVG